ncbi:kinase family protein [Arabidopsis lyrata subsp. lyrata]|uniref:Kinase family protein n=1 Tax=Arabidopsis lyrata subsp. lyrata TaxID=81972 RepID=D7MEU1_ARALL|nr:kinase family protein [Arabidopsis lyrata subsp. lyrata]
MEHVRVIFFFFACVLTFVPFICSAQTDKYEFPPSFNCVASGGNFTANSTFADNLNGLVSSLSSLTSKPYGFYNLSSGDSSGERAYAIALCRREVKRDDCLSCIQIAARNLIEQCPRTKQAVVWYTHCMFRYSNMIIYGRKETTPTLSFQAGKNISANRDEFDRLQIELLDRLKGIAAAGGPIENTLKGAVRVWRGTRNSTEDCNDCLVFGFERIPRCCDGQVGLRWFFPSCSFRFETWRFYEFDSDLEPDPPAIQPADPPTSAARTERTGKGKGGSKVIIAIVVPIVLVAGRRTSLEVESKVTQSSSSCYTNLLTKNKLFILRTTDEFSDSLLVDFETLKAATDNFSPENELGRGGFGSVYKGVFSGGQEIAVKRLSCTSGQGDIEFKNEILLLAKLQHRNLKESLSMSSSRTLVLTISSSVIFFCRLLHMMILPFCFPLSVDLCAVADIEKRQLLDWGVRYKMIGGVARGLLYLHEDSRYRIIHRDLKASNILLDQEMNPKIADFGLAKLFDTDQTSTHRFTSKIAGTYGYMAPEYAIYGQFSVKTDVFSFGVLVIEIITGKGNNNGRSNNDEDAENLLSWVWRCWREDIILSVIDPSLTTGSRSEILRCIHIGLLCVQESAASRPTMDSVALMLNSYSYTLPTPSRPAFVSESVMPSIVSSSTEPLLMSLNDVTVSELPYKKSPH